MREQDLGLQKSERLAAVVLFVFTAFCLSDVLLPTFDQIEAFDESQYVGSGYRLVEKGELRAFNWSPLAAVFYGFVYLWFEDQQNWFVHTAMAGRAALFGLVWMGLFACARALSPKVNPTAVMTLASAWLVVGGVSLKWNSSDYLFVAMAAFALSHLLALRSSVRTTAHLGWGSAFVGLSALARQDGVILFLSFLLLAAWLSPRDGAGVRWRRTAGRLAAAGLPFAVMAGGYMALYGAVTGNWFVGTMSRTYFAFEQGHGVTFSERYSGNPYLEGYDDVRALFGAPADNDGSVFKAVARNPRAFLDRVVRSAQRLPGLFHRAYGGSWSAVFFLLAAAGAAFLWRTRQQWLLVVSLVWHLHLLSYFLTFWTQRYVRFAFVWMALLGAFGAGAAASHFKARLNAPALDPRLRRWSGVRLRRFAAPACCMAVLAAGGYAERYPLLRIAAVGVSPQEQARAFLADTLPPGARIAAYGHKLPVASGMDGAAAAPFDLPVTGGAQPTPAAAEAWLHEVDVDAVYVGGLFRFRYERLFDLLLDVPESSGDFVVGFADADSHTYVLVRPHVADPDRFVDGLYDAPSNLLAARSGRHDVFLDGDELTYVVRPCIPDDAEEKFFVHVFPVDEEDLSGWHRRHGFTNRDFDFDEHSVRTGGDCFAVRTLPRHPIRRIVTGQFIPGEGRVWEATIDLAAPRRR